MTAGAELPQQCGGGPEHRLLAVEITGSALALQVILQVVLLPGAFADAGYVVVLVDEAGEGYLCLARSGAVGSGIEPAVFHAGDEGKGEHARA